MSILLRILIFGQIWTCVQECLTVHASQDFTSNVGVPYKMVQNPSMYNGVTIFYNQIVALSRQNCLTDPCNVA